MLFLFLILFIYKILCIHNLKRFIYKWLLYNSYTIRWMPSHPSEYFTSAQTYWAQPIALIYGDDGLSYVLN